MALARRACSACAVVLALLAGARARRAGRGAASRPRPRDGSVHARALPAAATAAVPAPPAPAAHPPQARPPRRGPSRASSSGSPAPARSPPRAPRAPRRLRRRQARRRAALTGTRKPRAHRGRSSTIDGHRRARQADAPRACAPLFLTLERNVEWWTTGAAARPPASASASPAPSSSASTTRARACRSSGSARSASSTARPSGASATTASRRAARRDRSPLASERAGGLAWEYLFAFGGGAPPWVEQPRAGHRPAGAGALAAQARPRGDVFRSAQRAWRSSDRAPPDGRARAGAGGGAHYLQYSFAPSLHILNGFVQSLVGLHDYAELTGDPTARSSSSTRATRERAREVPDATTPAPGRCTRAASSTHESDLGYHALLRDFLTSMCDRTRRSPSTAAPRSASPTYLSTPPVRQDRRRRSCARSTLRHAALSLSKISRVTVRITRGSTRGHQRAPSARSPTARTRSAGRRRSSAGTYTVTVSARDLAGNTARPPARSRCKPVKKPTRG